MTSGVDHLLVRRGEQVLGAPSVERGVKMSSPYSAHRPLVRSGSAGSSAGKCTSWSPIAANSDRTISVTRSSTSLPSGSQAYPPGATRRM